MSIISLEFALFVLLGLLIYYLTLQKFRWVALLCISLVFCFLTNGMYALFIVAVSCVSYFGARYIDRTRGERRKTARRTLWVTVIAILALLVAMKLCVAYPSLLCGEAGNVIMPLGMSFCTLRAISGVVDVYRKKREPERSVWRQMLVICYFPSLPLGPIGRYGELADEIFVPSPPRWESLVSGGLNIAWGAFKKLVIAETVAPAVRVLAENSERYSGAYVLLLAVAYSVEIYGDFTGGYDMMCGISRLFGIRLAPNFNRPFSSVSVREFWNRWHISLGAFFSEYVFYPLSLSHSVQKMSKLLRKYVGNAFARKLPIIASLILTWSMTGLWHGFAANYIVWGLSNCAIILVSDLLEPFYARVRNFAPKLFRSRGWQAVSKIRTFMLIALIRLFDVYRDVPLTFSAIKSAVILLPIKLISIFSVENIVRIIPIPSLILICVSSVVVFLFGKLQEYCRTKHGADLFDHIPSRPYAALITLAVLSFAVLVFGSYGVGYDARDFIYSEF